MAKKSLPKAIRPGVVSAGTSDPDPRVSEPVPEGASYSAARQASSIPAMDVTEIAAGERKARARKLVERFSLWSGVAGLLPVPVVDLAAIGGVQLQMLRRISQIFDIPFSKNRGKAIMASFAGTMIPAIRKKSSEMATASGSMLSKSRRVEMRMNRSVTARGSVCRLYAAGVMMIATATATSAIATRCSRCSNGPSFVSNPGLKTTIN